MPPHTARRFEAVTDARHVLSLAKHDEAAAVAARERAEQRLADAEHRLAEAVADGAEGEL
jgi:hypothetical protein